MKIISFFILILFYTASPLMAEQKPRSLSELRIQNIKKNNPYSMHGGPSLAPRPFKNNLKHDIDNPNYGRPKYTFDFTEEDYRIIDELKQFSADEMDKMVNSLKDKQFCFDKRNSCEAIEQSYIKARLTRLKKSNLIFRRLIGVFKILYPDENRHIDFSKVNKVNFLERGILEHANIQQLKFSDFEKKNITYVYKKVHYQINRYWTAENKKYKDYIQNRLSSIKYKAKLKNNGPIIQLPAIKLYNFNQVQKLRSYYLHQITSMISKEPILLFINSHAIKKEIMVDAYDRYIGFIQSQKTKIKGYTEDEDILSLVNMYQTLPEERQNPKLSDGGHFVSKYAWEAFLEEIKRVDHNKKLRNNGIIITLAGATASKAFAATFPLFGTIILAAFITKGLVEIYKQNNLRQHNITYWLSGMEPYSKVIERNNKVDSEAIMIGFFGFSILPTLGKVISAEKDFLTLKGDDMESFVKNVVEYGKARLKGESKGGVASNNEFEDDIFDVYLKVNGKSRVFIPKVVIDFNDYRVIQSGCLTKSTYNCNTTYSL